MKTLLLTLVVGVAPLFSTQAFIEKPAKQFKTLAEIQAEAQASLASENKNLTATEKRQQRLLNFTRARNSGVNRVKSAKESFKPRLVQKKSTASGRINKARIPRRGAALFSNFQTTERTTIAAPKRSIRERLSARLQRLKAMEEKAVEAKAPQRFEFMPQPGQLWGR